MKTTNVVNDDDGDYHYVYDDKLYPIGTLTTKTPVTLPLMLDPPPRESTQGKGNKILLPKQMLQNRCCKDYQHSLHNHHLQTRLKNFQMRLNKLSIHCIKQNKFQRMYKIIYSNEH